MERIVKFKGNPLTLEGWGIKAGDKALDFDAALKSLAEVVKV